MSIKVTNNAIILMRLNNNTLFYDCYVDGMSDAPKWPTHISTLVHLHGVFSYLENLCIFVMRISTFLLLITIYSRFSNKMTHAASFDR